jgi:peptidoglycan hydrolase-like protein with peptidoglycan-binding domain
MSWRVAQSLLKLRAQVDAEHPSRRKDSDGTIGDASHASRSSDHNPWVQDNGEGIVTAMDITHDPAHGVDTYALAELMRQRRDPRIKYIISNRKIASSSVHSWEWRAYTGSNPHDHHVHISVLSDKAHYDNTASWNIDGMPAAIGQTQEGYPVLQVGDQGPNVTILQKALQNTPDGYFGSETDARVKAFQSTHGLIVDGVVGQYTWKALNIPVSVFPRNAVPAPLVNTDIVATVFGGSGDPNGAAYGGRPINDTELGIALPFRFTGTRPKVKVTNKANGQSVVADIVDIGPWNINDPYWVTHARPEAETGRDNTGRETNHAGIDLTPGTAKAIGIAGKGLVDWEFVTTAAPVPAPQPKEPPVTTPTPAPLPVQLPALPTLDLAAIEHTFQAILPLLPVLAPMFPQAVPVVAMIQVGIHLAATVQSGGNVLTEVPNALRSIAAQVETMFLKKA